jgi:hypothetical protein
MISEIARVLTETARSESDMSVNRRQFLGMTAAGAALSLTRLRGAELGESHHAHTLASPELLSVVGPVEVRDIGRAYRTLVPAESDRDVLEAALRDARTSPDAMARADFAAERTVVVRGWVLSRTEARQCALFSLLGA